jgi:hypothetical protein
VTFATAAFQQAHAATGDTVVVESPLPGGVAEVVRFLLNTVPPWVQIGGIVLGIAVAALASWYLFPRRYAIREWFVTRSRGVRLALGGVAVALAVAAGAMGTATWNYTQHSNDFCIGCHVMNPAFQKFSNLENKHGKLSCHDCHQQSIFASSRQLYLWVAERPAEIGEHAKVPNRVCATCHVTADTAKWQRIAATAGHRVHLESDSSSLKDLQCVSCHGAEVHAFRPVAQTCGQSGCHEANATDIVLGKMATQTIRHCTSCHAFTADVPALATRDSARGTMVPGKQECLGCHEMERVLKDFSEAKDPHGGKCGTCHNPHVQKVASAAAATCATAGCHSNWRDEPFHVGPSHKNAGPKCLTCHVPHASKVDASNCEGCHVAVRAKGTLRPPIPFDTTSALRRPSGPSPDFDDEAHSRPPPVAPDSFPHARHAKLACLECHQTATGRGRLTFEPPRGCAICHHQAPTPAGCASCHRTEKYGVAKPATVTVTVPGRQPSTRPVDFLHDRHSTRTCVECHTTPVTLAPDKAVCQGCHTEHHAAERVCSSCHTLASPKVEHKTLEIAHQRCDACHTPASIALLTPARNFCSTCHSAQAKNHYEPKECSVCHFLAVPGAHRSSLTTPPPR